LIPRSAWSALTWGLVGGLSGLAVFSAFGRHLFETRALSVPISLFAASEVLLTIGSGCVVTVGTNELKVKWLYRAREFSYEGMSLLLGRNTLLLLLDRNIVLTASLPWGR
jgi:hypothetical protein